MERRRKEEGHEELLGIDEWAFYDDAQTVSLADLSSMYLLQ
jgi:hypothetical protein